MTSNEGVSARVVVGLLAVMYFLLWRLCRWVMDAPRTPTPWDAEVDAGLNREDALPLCNHCLTPQEHDGWFCPVCGSTVGPYANYLPYVNLFAQGEVLRSGTMQPVRKGPLILLGYILLALQLLGACACLLG